MLALRSPDCTGHLFILLVLFQFSFFLLSTLRLFLLFLSAFIFLSFIAHICCSLLEDYFVPNFCDGNLSLIVEFNRKQNLYQPGSFNPGFDTCRWLEISPGISDTADESRTVSRSILGLVLRKYGNGLALPPETRPCRMSVNSSWTHSGNGKDHGQETAGR